MTIHAGWGQNLPINDDEIKRAAISAIIKGSNELVAAAAGLKIKVLGMVLFAAGAVDVRLDSEAAGTALTGIIELSQSGIGLGSDSLIVAMSPPGYQWLETIAGESLSLELSDAIQVSGLLVYQLSA